MVLTPLASRQSIKTPLTYLPAAALEYYEKVLGYGPIAHFPIWDPFGSETAEELVNSPAQDGTHSNVTLGQDGIGDGRTSGRYDGATSFTNVFTPTLQGAFDGSEFTVMVWARVNDATVWTNGVLGYLWRCLVNVNNSIFLCKYTTDSQLYARYRAGAVSKIFTHNTSTLDWFCLALTASASADEARLFFNGVQSGATQNGLGVWAGVIGTALIGSSDPPPLRVWHGWEAHVVVFDYALPPAAVLDLAVI